LITRTDKVTTCIYCDRKYKRGAKMHQLGSEFYCTDMTKCNKLWMEKLSKIPLEVKDDNDDEAEGMESDSDE
jgi:hypothetical protein